MDAIPDGYDTRTNPPSHQQRGRSRSRVPSPDTAGIDTVQYSVFAGRDSVQRPRLHKSYHPYRVLRTDAAIFLMAQARPVSTDRRRVGRQSLLCLSDSCGLRISIPTGERERARVWLLEPAAGFHFGRILSGTVFRPMSG